MPAYFNTNNASLFPQAGGVWLTGMGTADLREHSARYLVIGLINNMPDGALEATERQFLSLLDAASGHLQVRLLRYALPGISRKGDAASRVKMFYSGVEKLWNTCPDGLIVTGREPLATNLRDEPYWKAFTEVIDWARVHTYSTVWSCLAAHAAVLYADGIVRRRSRTKHCGVFECARVTEHPLTAGIGSQIQMPHSRWNGLSEFA
ncbi:MAG TPA: homoserine O-succinyltransferase, partial [Candidatus Angelobacter sp.]|nr:homoserine O-succinyltransferase [Candidatus Angelobacter sp.]